MKKIFKIMIMAIIAINLIGCQNNYQETDVDIDITLMNEEVATNKLIDVNNNLDKYKGKIIKLNGIYEDRVYNGNQYHFCVRRYIDYLNDIDITIPIEFKLKRKLIYPEFATYVMIIGKIDTYKEKIDGETKEFLILTNTEIVEDITEKVKEYLKSKTIV